MPIEAFTNEFSDVTICMLHEDYHYSWTKANIPPVDSDNKAYCAVYFTALANTHGFISV